MAMAHTHLTSFLIVLVTITLASISDGIIGAEARRLLEIPEVPKPTVPEIPKPTLPEIPKPTLPEFPKPTLPEIPKPTIPEIPKPTIPCWSAQVHTWCVARKKGLIATLCSQAVRKKASSKAVRLVTDRKTQQEIAESSRKPKKTDAVEKTVRPRKLRRETEDREARKAATKIGSQFQTDIGDRRP
ncbi:hypothetical protein OSB04_016336 [Centaurea solstitialis]|uniref:Uncharacterized protein n=1 Tax=Centaurea solstitialis TaxID=347529 RepID=A0AA38WKZ0_9ASTR|nr:hypothetical protein OSB04_016336 [Centaurea solstitialis]